MKEVHRFFGKSCLVAESTRHFWMQRLTALANSVLFLFFIILVISLVGRSYTSVRGVLAIPFVNIFMLMMLLSGIYHMKLGMQTIIEDYIRIRSVRVFMLALNVFFSFILGAACIIALLEIFLKEGHSWL
ncbi:MAG: membrane anchor subunit [Candidatus Tokpelaia sp. JSC161]|nr:MAG: membrane anchor subunit [Candidatus Tokpelaia sp. JSC161]